MPGLQGAAGGAHLAAGGAHLAAGAAGACLSGHIVLGFSAGTSLPLFRVSRAPFEPFCVYIWRDKAPLFRLGTCWPMLLPEKQQSSGLATRLHTAHCTLHTAHWQAKAKGRGSKPKSPRWKVLGPRGRRPLVRFAGTFLSHAQSLPLLLSLGRSMN